MNIKFICVHITIIFVFNIRSLTIGLLACLETFPSSTALVESKCLMSLLRNIINNRSNNTCWLSFDLQSLFKSFISEKPLSVLFSGQHSSQSWFFCHEVWIFCFCLSVLLIYYLFSLSSSIIFCFLSCCFAPSRYLHIFSHLLTKTLPQDI